MRLGDLGERYLVNYILDRAQAGQDMMLPKGDDAAAFWFNGLMVACVDMLVWETDVPPGMTWLQAGRKAVVSAVSDAASKGARPRFLLVSLGLSSEMEFEDFKQLVEGIIQAAESYGARVVGGDLNEQRSPCVSVAVMASAKSLMSRRGARPGDLVATTGFFGRTYAGLHASLHRLEVSQNLLKAVHEPEARVVEGVVLADSGGVSACVDSSDGLAECLHLLAEASGVGVVVDSLPVDAEAEAYCVEHGLSVYDAVLYGGEEYELVFTVKSGWEKVVESCLRKVGREFKPLGQVVSEPGVYYEDGGGKRPVERKGWQHFNQFRKPV
ncbi:MAG: thiamine-phosphate kinase [Candidatus Caldarchaeum sp.]